MGLEVIANLRVSLWVVVAKSSICASLLVNYVILLGFRHPLSFRLFVLNRWDLFGGNEAGSEQFYLLSSQHRKHEPRQKCQHRGT